MRAGCDAVLVGARTLLQDDPQLTVRMVPGASPLRVVLDSTLRTPLTAKVLSDDAATVILCRPDADPARRRALAATGATVRDVAAGPDGLRDRRRAAPAAVPRGRVAAGRGRRPGDHLDAAARRRSTGWSCRCRRRSSVRASRRSGRSGSTASPTASGSSTGRCSSPATTSCSASTWRRRPPSRARDRRAEDVRRHRRDTRARVGGADRSVRLRGVEPVHHPGRGDVRRGGAGVGQRARR